MNWYIEVLKKYAVFSGRARRKEYWMFTLFSTIIALVLGFIEDIVRGIVGIAPETNQSILVGIYTLAVLIPSIAVSVRRLHDTGRSGWWVLISLVPLIGVIVLIVFTVQDSQQEDNQYGPNPKMATT